MTIARLEFAGFIKKAEVRQAGEQTINELSICKKRRTKEGEEPSFDWYRVTLWKAAEFQLPKLVKGSYISGSGEFTSRSYVDKNGVKQSSMEIKCTSFDVEVVTKADFEGVAAAPASAPPVVKKPAALAPESDDMAVPF